MDDLVEQVIDVFEAVGRCVGPGGELGCGIGLQGGAEDFLDALGIGFEGKGELQDP